MSIERWHLTYRLSYRDVSAMMCLSVRVANSIVV